MPFPLANEPACNVAVNPVTPVDEIAAPEVYATPLPPVYPTVEVPEYVVLAVAIAEKFAPTQFNEEIEGVIIKELALLIKKVPKYEV